MAKTAPHGAAHEISLLEALGILVKVADMEYSIHGNRVKVNDPRKPIEQKGAEGRPQACSAR